MHKPLLSVTQCADTGVNFLLDKSGECLIDHITSETIPIRTVHLYVLKMWSSQSDRGGYKSGFSSAGIAAGKCNPTRDAGRCICGNLS